MKNWGEDLGGIKKFLKEISNVVRDIEVFSGKKGKNTEVWGGRKAVSGLNM